MPALDQPLPADTPTNAAAGDPVSERDSHMTWLPRGKAVRAAWAMAWVYLLLRLLTWNPYFPRPTLDPSWVFALHDAWVQGMAFGREFVFTYGPFGFVATEAFDPRTYAQMLLLQALVLTVLTCGVMGLCGGLRRGWQVLAAMGLVTEALALRPTESVGWALIWVTLMYGLQARPRAWLVNTLTAAAALTALMKFTYTVAAAGVMLAIALDTIGRRRRVPWAMFTWTAALLAFWLAAGQRPGDLAGFTRWSWDMADSYAESMGLAGPTLELIAFLAGTSAVIAMSVLTAEFSGWMWLRAGAAAGLMFMVFKAAFVRHDALHAATACAALTACGVIVLSSGQAGATAPPRRRWMGIFSATWAAATITLTASVASSADTIVRLPTPPRLAADLAANLRGAWDAMNGAPAMRQRHAAAQRKLRDDFSLPIAPGGMDIYNLAQAIPLAHGAERRPRPVPQSYAAHSPAMAELHAAHLRDPGAPRWVYLNTETLDLRLTALNDGPSWIEFMHWYDPVSTHACQSEWGNHTFLRLCRRDQPIDLARRPLGSTRLAVGQGVDLPPTSAGAVLVARIDLRLRPAGKLAKLLLRPPVAWIDLRQRDGYTPRARFVPAAAQTSFVLSPLITSPTEFAGLFDAPRPSRPNDVLSLRLWIDPADRWAYETEATVSLEQMIVSRATTAPTLQ